MTTRQVFRTLWAERRNWPPGTRDHDYRTRAARQLFWMLKGIPACDWPAQEVRV